MKKIGFAIVAIAFGILAVGGAQATAQEAPAQNPVRASAQAGGPQAAPADSEAADRGAKQFKQTCAFCHGEDATGGRGPDLIRSALVRHDRNGDLIGPVVTQGRPDRGMPPFPFNSGQIADVAAFLHAQIDLFDLHIRRPGGYGNDIPVSRLATGTVEAGKAYFYGAGGCSKCHSPAGDLAGIATKYDPQNLQSRFLYPAGVQPTATVTLPSGQQFSGTVLLNDEDNIGIRDTNDGWYHSWPKSAVKKVEVHDPLAAHQDLLMHKFTDADMHNLFTYLETLK